MYLPVENIVDPAVTRHGINLLICRLDKMHNPISGNKWFKLMYNIPEMKKQGKTRLLTFGGAFSNHIAATAAAGREHDFDTIGVIRGDELKNENLTLSIAEKNGMRLHFVSREEYRRKNGTEFIEELKKKFGDFYLLPEGGSNSFAVKGCSEIISSVKEDFDYACCPVGTGATLAGLILSLKKEQHAIGFAALAGAAFLQQDVKNFLADAGYKETGHNWKIFHDYHFGRYGKITKELLSFSGNFYEINKIPLDYVYTAKMMYGIYDLISKGYFLRGEKILAIHTGGLQGNDGFVMGC